VNAVIAKRRGAIGVYRPYELQTLLQGRLDLQDLLSYHAQYHWADYAAVVIGMVLLSITLLVTSSQALGDVCTTIQWFAIVFMTVASILLIYADLVHTNSQTPIIPIRQRFRLIDVSVRFGMLGTMLIILSVMFFIAMVSVSATIFCCVVYIGVLWYVFFQRQIPKAEFFEYFGVHSATDWPEEDHQYIRSFYGGDGIPYKSAGHGETEVAFLRKLMLSSIGEGDVTCEFYDDVFSFLKISKQEATKIRDQVNREVRQLRGILQVARQHELPDNVYQRLVELGRHIGLDPSEVEETLKRSDEEEAT
jgi:hypothetical protein